MATIEYFGTTTFRVKANGVTLFHDAFLERPPFLARHLEIEDVLEADYIFISHAHFDHITGADKLALRTGAIVIGNSEAIHCLRAAGVPDEQLMPVSGGERIPLITRATRERAARREGPLANDAPGAPPRPHDNLAALSVHVWPALHALMPVDNLYELPEVFNTGEVFTGSTMYNCTQDITRLMRNGMFKFKDHLPNDTTDEKLIAFGDWVSDRQTHVMSACDGGQLAYNVLIDEKAVFFNSQLGAYNGVLEYVTPKPDFAIFGVGGRGNLNGRPFDGSAADFLTLQVKGLGEPQKIAWCLHDDFLFPPLRTDTSPAKEKVQKETSSRVVDLRHTQVYNLFD